jgi:hypothetical protein
LSFLLGAATRLAGIGRADATVEKEKAEKARHPIFDFARGDSSAKEDDMLPRTSKDMLRLQYKENFGRLDEDGNSLQPYFKPERRAHEEENHTERRTSEKSSQPDETEPGSEENKEARQQKERKTLYDHLFKPSFLQQYFQQVGNGAGQEGQAIDNMVTTLLSDKRTGGTTDDTGGSANQPLYNPFSRTDSTAEKPTQSEMLHALKTTVNKFSSLAIR